MSVKELDHAVAQLSRSELDRSRIGLSSSSPMHGTGKLRRTRWRVVWMPRGNRLTDWTLHAAMNHFATPATDRRSSYGTRSVPTTLLSRGLLLGDRLKGR